VQGGRLVESDVPLDHIPVFGREGTLLPLGPAVQHTGQLSPGLDLQEVWAFGKPTNGIQLPGLDLSVLEGKVPSLPQNVKWIQK
jgi:alpha-D-xyloside xylohydrolase